MSSAFRGTGRSSRGPTDRQSGRLSVGPDRPEAVRAIDRPIHPGLERHMRLVAAGRADDREVLAARAVIAALVAARAADVADVVAAVTRSPAAGPAARAALRVADEPLLDVVLLVSGRVDEFHAAVDAVQGSIDVGHVAPPGAVDPRGARRRATASTDGICVVWRLGAGAARPRLSMWSPCLGAHRFVVRRRIQRLPESSRERLDGAAAPAGGGRDNVPVTMAADDPVRRAGSHGGASLAPLNGSRPGQTVRTDMTTEA